MHRFDLKLKLRHLVPSSLLAQHLDTLNSVDASVYLFQEQSVFYVFVLHMFSRDDLRFERIL